MSFWLGLKLLMKLIGWLAPIEEPLSFTEEEQERYLDGWMPSVLAYVLFATLCSTVLFACLHLLFALLARPRIASLVILEPVPHLWGIIALFLGFLVADWPTSWWFRNTIGADSERFERFHDQRLGYDSRRIKVVFWWMFGVGAVVLFAAGLTKTDQLTTQGIVVGEAFVANPPLRPYNTVRSIETRNVIRKRDRRRPQTIEWFVITFDDGTRWTTRTVWWDAEDRTLARTVLELVSARSGRQIEER